MNFRQNHPDYILVYFISWYNPIFFLQLLKSNDNFKIYECLLQKKNFTENKCVVHVHVENKWCKICGYVLRNEAIFVTVVQIPIMIIIIFFYDFRFLTENSYDRKIMMLKNDSLLILILIFFFQFAIYLIWTKLMRIKIWYQ